MMHHNLSPAGKVQLLESLNGIKRAKPSPFFYTRLIARLESAQSSICERIRLLLLRPAIAFLCIFMIIAINLFAILSHTKSMKNSSFSEVASSIDDYTQASNSSFYDPENVRP